MSSRIVEVGGNIAAADQMGRVYAAYAKDGMVVAVDGGHLLNLYVKTRASNLSILFRILP
jgi:hypothetical protein